MYAIRSYYGQTSFIDPARRTRRLDGAPLLPLVPTIAEAALACQHLEVVEQARHPGLAIAELQLTHAGAVDQQAAFGEQVQAAVGGGVTRNNFV